MLQLTHLNARVLERLRASGELQVPAADPRSDGIDLERAVDTAIARLRAERVGAARGLTHLGAALDRRLFTERVEHMDRDDCPPEEKVRLVRALHRMNQVFLSYWRFLRLLRPFIDDVQRREGRALRVLELASGSGEFTLALARAADRRALPVEITGSDIQPAYVARANAEAAARGVPARFIELNAFAMDTVPPGRFDLVFIAQSTHHFQPGQLARMVRHAHRISHVGFMSVDGQRSLSLLALLFGVGGATSALLGSTRFLHDAVVTARRLYSEPELQLIAEMAAPEAAVGVRTVHPGFSVLTALRQT